MVGLQEAQLSGHGPQCCSSSPLSLNGWRTVQSAKNPLLLSIPAASTISAVIAPWISVSHTTGKPSSFSRALAAQGIMPISPCSAFQHWIAPAEHPYRSARFRIATFRAATFNSSSSLMAILKCSLQ